MYFLLSKLTLIWLWLVRKLTLTSSKKESPMINRVDFTKLLQVHCFPRLWVLTMTSKLTLTCRIVLKEFLFNPTELSSKNESLISQWYTCPSQHFGSKKIHEFLVFFDFDLSFTSFYTACIAYTQSYHYHYYHMDVDHQRAGVLSF